MEFHEQQLKVIKELILEYQQIPNEKTFLHILERVDKLLEEIIKQSIRLYFFNEPATQLAQDLYQTSIIGLEKAIKLFRPEEKASTIPLCIKFSVRKELFDIYGVHKLDPIKYLEIHPDCIEESEVDANLIQEDIRNIFKDAVETGKVSVEDMELLILRYVQGLSVSSIVKMFDGKWGTHLTTTRRLKKVLSILQKEFISKGFE